MFIAFIAIALELGVMALGAKLIISCCKACFKRHLFYTQQENVVIERTEGHVKEYHKHGGHCFGFFKFIGYFTMILSFIALVCTFVSLSCFMKDIKNLERDHNGPSEQYRYDLDKLRIYSDNHKALEMINVTPNDEPSL
jgi:hypothetical protein